MIVSPYQLCLLRWALARLCVARRTWFIPRDADVRTALQFPIAAIFAAGLGWMYMGKGSVVVESQPHRLWFCLPAQRLLQAFVQPFL